METKKIKLSPKKGGNGYLSSYSISIGIAEAKECGLVGEDGRACPVEKIVDPANHQIIIRLAAGV